MQVVDYGGEKPEYVVIGMLHGDEPCGKRAIERFLDAAPAVTEPVRFIIANERAHNAGKHHIDADLNRAFPGNPDSDNHEERIASTIWEKIQGKTVLDLHSTVSTDTPIGILIDATPATAALAQTLGVDHVVDLGTVTSGSLIEQINGVAVECGRRGTDKAAENAHRILRHFLAAHDILDQPAQRNDPLLYRATAAVPKHGHRFTATNLQQVDTGEVYAQNGDDVLRADEPFYPVLMSSDGYDDILGFKAVQAGHLSEIIRDTAAAVKEEPVYQG